MSGSFLPYFQVYAAETLADERFSCWTVAERGAWFTLLLHAWVNGSIPSDEESLARLCHLDADAMRSHWARIADRFVPHPEIPGRLVSPRQEEAREEALSKSESASRAAKSRWSKPNRKNANAMRPHSDRNASAMPADQRNAAQISTAQQARTNETPAPEATDLGTPAAPPPTPETGVKPAPVPAPLPLAAAVQMRWPAACALHALLAEKYPAIGFARGAPAETLETACGTHGTAAVAVALIAFAERKGETPGSTAWFAKVLPDAMRSGAKAQDSPRGRKAMGIVGSNWDEKPW